MILPNNFILPQIGINFQKKKIFIEYFLRAKWRETKRNSKE